MRIAAGAVGPSPDTAAELRFGRAPWILLYDSETGGWEALAGRDASSPPHGGGARAARKVVSAGASVVLAGHYCAATHRVLAAGGVRVCRCEPGTVEQAVAAFERGALTPLEPGAPDHEHGHHESHESSEGDTES